MSYVVFTLQPRIDGLFGKIGSVSAGSKKEIEKEINNLRLQRKKTASACLFVLLAVLLLAIQIRAPLPLVVNSALLALAALFAYRVFKANVPYGWV